jgi:hypothetical protein
MTETHPAARVLTDGATPAEVAQAALDAIAADRAGFNMESWVSSTAPPISGPCLDPGKIPSVCGTALCAAGMIAHLLGWELCPDGEAARDRALAYAPQVAERALRIKPSEGANIWYSSEEEALDQLRRLAAGGCVLVPETDD